MRTEQSTSIETHAFWNGWKPFGPETYEFYNIIGKSDTYLLVPAEGAGTIAMSSSLT